MPAELRAALAIARKDLRTLGRYRISMVAMVFNPLYQGVIPGFLFGAAFAVGGRVVGLESSVGTADLAGYIFFGNVVSALVAVAFWSMAMGLRNEMDAGTLEPSWLTPTRRDTLVIGRALSGVVVLLFAESALFVIGIAFFGLHVDARVLLAVPAMALAVVAMVGVAYLIAAAVLLLKEANLFVDTTNFLFSIGSGVAFPITFLPGVLQAVALLFPTTYAVDILRYHAIGARPLFDPALEHAALVATALLIVPLGRRAFAAAERRMRVQGTLAQH